MWNAPNQRKWRSRRGNGFDGGVYGISPDRDVNWRKIDLAGLRIGTQAVLITCRSGNKLRIRCAWKHPVL